MIDESGSQSGARLVSSRVYRPGHCSEPAIRVVDSPDDWTRIRQFLIIGAADDEHLAGSGQNADQGGEHPEIRRREDGTEQQGGPTEVAQRLASERIAGWRPTVKPVDRPGTGRSRRDAGGRHRTVAETLGTAKDSEEVEEECDGLQGWSITLPKALPVRLECDIGHDGRLDPGGNPLG